MKTKMISLMKNTKDRMDNLMPQAERLQLIDVLKTTGATHLEVATVLGHPNFIPHSQAWAKDIHDAGLLVTWRNAHVHMEGLYGQAKLVGATRILPQLWIDQALTAFTQIKDAIKEGDEEAIYPERTEGIFADDTSFLAPQDPDTYALFFIALHTALKAFPWTVGLSANNASELLSGWMPRAFTNYAGVAVIDHYRDGDPSLFDSEVRAINQKYSVPVYVQEGAPDRFSKPTRGQCDAYYAVCKSLADEGILESFGSWSGWSGTNESIVDLVNGQYQLNDNGLSLQAWWNPTQSIEIEKEESFIIKGKTSKLAKMKIDGVDRGYIHIYKNK